MNGIQPALDFLVIQMDWGCIPERKIQPIAGAIATRCDHKGDWNPLECGHYP